MKHFPRLSLFFLPLILLFGCHFSENNSKRYLVGFVNLSPRLQPVIDGFKSGMREKGFLEGRNITFLNDRTVFEISELDNALQEMVAKKVDLVVTLTTPATKKAQEFLAGKNIPIVFAPVFDPVASGIVSDFRHENELLTGIKVGGGIKKALEYLIEVAPQVHSILVPYDSDNKATRLVLDELRDAAEKLDVHLAVVFVKDREELERLITVSHPGIDALWLLNSYFLVNNIDLFVESSIRQKMPLGSATSQGGNGVLITYGHDDFRLGISASRLAAKIFQGTSVKDIPIQSADFYLCINLGTAEQIGLNIPEHLLIQADTIFR